MWLYAKAAFILILSILLMVAGWRANGWRHQAQLVEAARAELRAEQQRRIDAVVEKNTAQKERDAARTELAELRLKAKEAEIAKDVKTVQRAITQHVKANPVCDVPEPVASQLQRLREGADPDLPPASP